MGKAYVQQWVTCYDADDFDLHKKPCLNFKKNIYRLYLLAFLIWVHKQLVQRIWNSVLIIKPAVVIICVITLKNDLQVIIYGKLITGIKGTICFTSF